MRQLSFAILALGLLLSTRGVAGAQSISAGSLPASPNFGFDPSPVAITAIDLSSPATGTGNMTSATFTWSLAPCTATVKIKFFRPSGSTLIFIDERGPFDVSGGTTVTVALSPVVSVQAGDLVGIARVASCGSPVGQSPGAAPGLVAFGADIMTSVTMSSGTLAPNTTLAVLATGTGSVAAGNPAAIIPVAISGPGQFGARFRVAVQLYNPTGTTITGRFVFHPQGVSGTTSDPSLAFAIDPGQTSFFGDLLASIGQTGIGSVDILVSTGGTPVASVRVFNDAGAAGTTGFTEDSFKQGEALGAGTRGVLVSPFNTAAYRFNVGVRTLSTGAAINITVRDSGGTILRTLSKTYPANYFEQTDVATFLGAFPLAANQSVSIDVVSGNLFIYGATADNTTNDPAVLFAKNIL